MRQRPLLTNTAEGRLRRRASRGGEEGEWAVVAGFPTSPQPPPGRLLVCECRAARRRQPRPPCRPHAAAACPPLAETELRAGQGQAAPRAPGTTKGEAVWGHGVPRPFKPGWAGGWRVPDDQGWCRGGWEGRLLQGQEGRPTPPRLPGTFTCGHNTRSSPPVAHLPCLRGRHTPLSPRAAVPHPATLVLKYVCILPGSLTRQPAHSVCRHASTT